ncbi:MAG: ABC transporter ATP-binding protein [Synergistetes bacterium]|nr:ABC transporter ATP-binding protein [Synergistota bacterium]
MAVLKVKDLKAYYMVSIYGIKRTVKAVDNVSLKVNENEIFGIAGESGCGKTTLVKVLSGMVKPPLTVLGGKIIYNFGDQNVDITSLQSEKLRKIRWEYVSYIPQGSMNVLNPVRRIRKTFRDFIGVHRKIKKENFETLVEEYLSVLGLPKEVLKAYPHQLSGGMRQRVTIALATILNPKVILADEPTTALDVVVQRGVIQLLKRIQREQKNAFVLVTHDMAVHVNLSNRIAIMYAGKIVEEAKTNDIFKNPLHPYTKYLIGSLPRIGDKSHRVSVPGAPPALSSPPSGCRFHPRCQYAKDICRKKSPTLVDVGDEHKVACFLNI